MYECILCNLNFKRNCDLNRHINSKRHFKTIDDKVPENELNIILEDEIDKQPEETIMEQSEILIESPMNYMKIPIINKNLTISTDSLKSVNLEKTRNKIIKQEEKEKKKQEIKEEKNKLKQEKQKQKQEEKQEEKNKLKQEKQKQKQEEKQEEKNKLKQEEKQEGKNKLKEEEKQEGKNKLKQEEKKENEETTNDESGINCHCSLCDKTYMKKKYYDKHLLSKVHIKNYKLKYQDEDERVPVINTKTGLVKYGKNAPLKLRLETFLLKYPDYKIYTKYSTNNALLTIKKELIKLIKVIDIQLKY